MVVCWGTENNTNDSVKATMRVRREEYVAQNLVCTRASLLDKVLYSVPNIVLVLVQSSARSVEKHPANLSSL